jgi:dynein heavy chain, axonemal
MEIMLINVINSSFDTVTYIEQGVEILDSFMHLNTREVCIALPYAEIYPKEIYPLSYSYHLIFLIKVIRRTVDKKTVELYQIFIQDLNTIKRDLTSKATVIDQMHPEFAGCAMWAKNLKRRIEK